MKLKMDPNFKTRLKWAIAVAAEPPMSQADLARRLSERGTGTTAQAVSQWCRGSGQPTQDRLEIIAELTGTR